MVRAPPGSTSEAAGRDRAGCPGWPPSPPATPKGRLEAFAQLHRVAVELVAARLEGREPDALAPTVEEGARGVGFLEAAVEAGRRGAWVGAALHPRGPGPRAGAPRQRWRLASSMWQPLLPSTVCVTRRSPASEQSM